MSEEFCCVPLRVEKAAQHSSMQTVAAWNISTRHSEDGDQKEGGRLSSWNTSFAAVDAAYNASQTSMGALPIKGLMHIPCLGNSVDRLSATRGEKIHVILLWCIHMLIAVFVHELNLRSPKATNVCLHSPCSEPQENIISSKSYVV